MSLLSLSSTKGLIDANNVTRKEPLPASPEPHETSVPVWNKHLRILMSLF